MRIENDVLEILRTSTIDEEKNILFLPNKQLDRKLYVSVNKCLESLGGKWNTKLKGHIFNTNPSDGLDTLINTGEWIDEKKEYQFFPTPKNIVKQMIELADIQPYEDLLEPEAGQGAILEEFPKENNYVAFELMQKNCDILIQGGYFVHCKDFLSVSIEDEIGEDNFFHKIIMNPPFSKQQDVQHIFHAWKMLRVGGRLVSIVSESPFFRENKLSKEFREWLDTNNAEIIELQSGDFKESGTMVKTRIIVVDKNETK